MGSPREVLGQDTTLFRTQFTPSTTPSLPKHTWEQQETPPAQGTFLLEPHPEATIPFPWWDGADSHMPVLPFLAAVSKAWICTGIQHFPPPLPPAHSAHSPGIWEPHPSLSSPRFTLECPQEGLGLLPPDPCPKSQSPLWAALAAEGMLSPLFGVDLFDPCSGGALWAPLPSLGSDRVSGLGCGLWVCWDLARPGFDDPRGVFQPQ